MIAGAVLAATWVALLVTSGRSRGAARGSAGRDAALLIATVLASGATCAAPVVRLVDAFREVATAPRDGKQELLEKRIDEARPVMLLPLLSIPIRVGGTIVLVSSRRRRRSAADARPPGHATSA